MNTGPRSQALVAGRGYSRADWEEVDGPEATDEQLAQATPFAEALPELAESIRRARGRPASAAAMEAVTLRLDPDTVARFKAAGKDWRARMRDVLARAEP